MVPRKLDEPTTITLNCGSTCKKASLIGAGVGAVLVGVPIIASVVALYIFGLYRLIDWLTPIARGKDGNLVAGIFAGIATIATIILIVSVFVVVLEEK